MYYCIIIIIQNSQGNYCHGNGLWQQYIKVTTETIDKS